MGGVLRRSAEIASDETTKDRFRVWLADQVTALLIPRR
jgi:hypothetical protein